MATDCKAEPLSKSVVKYSIDLNCDPCSYGNIIVKATHFCRTCEDPEPLCENCSTQHIRQKMSRHHQICENIREFPKEHMKTDEDCNLKELTCVPCSFENVHVKAAYFCHTCKDPEPLCETCSTQHTRQKLTRGHEICKDIWKYFKLHAILGENNQHEKEVECDPCFIENIHVKATHFCKTCVDPEPLCDECAKQHTRQKTCRDHELCKDVEEFLKFQSKNGVDSHKEVYIECDPCLNDGTKVTASHFCKTCEDPEPLCETCAKQHTRQKAFRDHEVSGNINNFPVHHLNKSGGFQQLEDILCDPCLNDDKKVTATHFCKTCVDPEPLCEPCAKQHTRQKAFRDHEASRSIHEFQKHCPKKSVHSHKEVYIECDPCSNEGTKVKATHICKTCEDPEPLCETCAKQHTRQKAFRDHKLSGIIREILKHPSNKGVDLEHEEDLACEPCLNGDKKVKATDFCKTCEDPEPLCAYCAKQHTRQRAFKEHKLSGHIHQFLKHPSNKSIIKVENTGLFCNSCLDANLQVKATQFCKTCNHPELLCETCAKQHLRQKSFRQHEMCGDIQSFSAKNTRNTAENLETFEDMYPGKPKATDIKSDAICLFWDKSVKQADQYQIRFKNKDGNMKWKITETVSDENNIMITGLMANENYIFQVRGIYGDQEGPYGAVSEDIYTKKSLATTLLDFSVLQRNTDCPRIYILPVEENKSARSTTARFRMFTLGKPTPYVCDEKTILLVGLKGSGKSTLVDGIVNYILGVSFDDPFRFSVFTLEENAEKAHYKASSKTQWITVYKIYPAEGSRLSYTLSIIDTPGFGDTTKGIEGDNDIVDQIRHLFFAQGDQGDMFIDAVCFIVKAPDAHLTVVQKNIFSLILSLFGKNIESNICTLITFADGTKPPVLASLNESKLPFGLTFNFNNSALFAGNKGVTHDTLSPMFWEMCSSSFERFFRHIKQLETRRLCQTKSVLDEREQLKTVISNIRPQISAGLSKLSELQQQLDIFKRYTNEMKDNQNFEYEVDEIKQEKIDLPKGQHVTNCIQCNVTCHEDCRIVDDDEKRGCWAMDKRTGCCRICSGKCTWSYHKNTPYIFKFVTVTKSVKKTYAEMKQRYEAALGQTLTHEKYIENLTYDVDELSDLITAMMNEMTDCKTRLNEIALRPDPLTAVEHIDLMIQSEEMDKQPGFLKRVQMLKEIKKMALVDPDVSSLGQNIRVTRENIKSVTGKSLQTRIRRKNQGSALTRGIQYVQTFLNNS